MKKFKLFALAAFAMLSINAMADEHANQTFTYTYTGGVAEITGFTDGLEAAKQADITIPATVKAKDGTTDLTVNTIHATAFQNNANITKVKIASPTITALGLSFQGCSNLATLDLSEATELATISDAAFKGTKLAKLDLSTTKVNTINNLFGTHTVKIGTEDPVANATLAEVKLNNTWTSFDPATGAKGGAFENCTALTTVNFGTATGANASIGAAAFKGSGITAVSLPATVKTIGDNAFENCASLASFSWAATTASSTIGVAAFKGCSALAIAMSIPQVVTSIGNNAFENSGLTGLTFAGTTPTITTIGTEFIKGSNITELNLAIASLAVTADADIFSSDKLKKVVFVEYNADKSVKVQANNAKLCDDWFSHSTALEEVVLGPKFTSIEEKAFKVTVLKSLDLSNTGVTTIPDLFGATQTAAYKTLTSVILPNVAGLAISSKAFAYCTKLDKITFPTKWVADGEVSANAFQGCTGITEVTFKPEDPSGFSGYGAFVQTSFSDCTAKIKIITTKAYSLKATSVPDNCEYVFAATTPKEITLNGKYALLKQTNAWSVSAEDAVVYSIYVDALDGTIYMMPYYIKGGNYEVAPTTPVLLKAKNAVDGKITIQSTDDALAGTLAYGTALQRNETAGKAVSELATTGYVNIATISNGVFGITSPAGTTLAAKTFYVISSKEYGAAGARIVWLDENEATAIVSAKKAAKEGGVMYNLAGQKVNAAYKGVVIKDGKKYIQK